MLIKLEIFRVGFDSLTAFPAPNPKFCSYWPTFGPWFFFSPPSCFFYSSCF